jgi:hypothetical protein
VAIDAFSSDVKTTGLVYDKLWPPGIRWDGPDEVAGAWHLLQSKMLREAEHWRVWVGWYECILVGGERSDAWEEAYAASMEPVSWRESSKNVNAKISERLTEISGQPKTDAVDPREEREMGKRATDDVKQPQRAKPRRLTTRDPNTRSKRKVKVVPKTEVGKATKKNRDQIVFSADALSSLVDARLESLRAERPNSDDGISIRDRAIAYHEDLRQRLTTLRGATLAFSVGKVEENKVIGALNSLMRAIADWWEKDHERICRSAFDLGLFLTYMHVCSMAGAGGNLAASISGALVGGKPVVDAIKAYFKSKRLS